MDIKVETKYKDISQLLQKKSSFLQGIKRGIKYTNAEGETIQITSILGKACYHKLSRSNGLCMYLL